MVLSIGSIALQNQFQSLIASLTAISVFLTTICDAGGNSGSITTSSDGETWTSRSGASGTIMGVSYGNGLYVASNSSGTIYGSTDGVTWYSKNSPSSCSYLSCLSHASTIIRLKC